MKRLLLMASLLLVAFNTYAGVCNNASLTGAYNFSVSGVSGGNGAHGVGRITFNGKGGASFGGIETASGYAASVVGSGTYSVTSACAASGVITWTNGVKTTYWLFLDHMDTVPAVSVAYHGNIVLKNTAGYSSSGIIDRVAGKF